LLVVVVVNSVLAGSESLGSIIGAGRRALEIARSNISKHQANKHGAQP
jgi:hypothetical protein